MARFDEKHRDNLASSRLAFSEQAKADRSADLAWMAEWHETPKGAARRLGISLDSLRVWCRRNDPDVLERLMENERRRQVAS